MSDDAKAFGGCLFALIVVVVAILIIGWVTSWGGKEAELTGPEHSQEQTTAVLDDWTSLHAQAQTYCQLKESKPSNGDPTLVEHPEVAYAAKYRSTEADYDRRMNNFFEAYQTRHIPLPGALRSLPRTSPTLSEAKVKWC